MTELLTSAQMRAIEQAAIDSGEVTGLELMERAGRGVVEAIFEEWPELAKAPRRAVVLCGPGNNGGDGFVVARLLNEWGWEVEVFLYGDAEKLPPDARVNFDKWRSLGEVTIRHINPPPLIHDTFHVEEDFDVLVDSLFGTGLGRPFGGLFSILADVNVRELLSEKGIRVVAIDIPTGICSDSGKVLGAVISADLTVSFHLRKLGHCLADGSINSGKTVVKSIGLEDRARPRAEAKRPPMGADGRCPAAPDEFVRLVSHPAKGALSKLFAHHKYSNGHALILSGGPGKTGAARLTARGALRVGAGLVTLGVPPAAQQEVASQITAVMLERVTDADALSQILQDGRISALCLGPGMGLDTTKRDLVAAALESKRPTVLDADALTLISQDADLFAAVHPDCVLTPHAGEFTRLFPDIAEQLNAPATKGPAYSKVDAARDAAKRAGCIVLFKGPDTVIAAPDGRCSINAALYDRAAPWLATAGSGDVLSGFITGLLARELQPMQAAEIGAWLHVECARAFGAGLIAEDLPEMLPQVFKELGL